MIWISFLVLVFILVVLGWIWLRRIRKVKAAFLRDQAKLRQRYFTIASQSGKPRGLIWVGCEWDDTQPPLFLRNRQSLEFVVLEGVTLSFEAVAGSDMEGLPNVGNLRSASAVFVFSNGTWDTQGRTIFNLPPQEAFEHFQDNYIRLRT